jgi:hypothetical protein
VIKSELLESEEGKEFLKHSLSCVMLVTRFSSIYLPDGRSLHAVALTLGQTRGGEARVVENIDYCTECGDGGELVLCDSCPGAYHPGKIPSVHLS